MNQRQQICLIASLSTVAVTVLFPPLIRMFSLVPPPGAPRPPGGPIFNVVSEPAGYGFIFATGDLGINWRWLLGEWLVIAVVGCAVFIRLGQAAKPSLRAPWITGISNILHLKRNRTLWDWMRETFSDEYLRELTTEAIDGLVEMWNPLGDETLDQHSHRQVLKRKLFKRLMRSYGDEIWSSCLGAGGYDPDKGRTGVKCLSKLDFAFQVHDQASFEEFLVRNAMKQAALENARERKV